MYMYVFLIHIHVHCTLYFILSYCLSALVEVLWLLCIVHMYVIQAQPAELPQYM